MYSDDDADLAWVQLRNVTVLGEGDQILAQSLCLRDSGVDVRLGLAPGSVSRDVAEAEGLRVLSPYEACEEADLVVLLGGLSEQVSLYSAAVAPNLVPGDVLMFGAAHTVAYGALKPPADIDVCLMAATAPGSRVRQEYSLGRGVAVLVAVEQDTSGEAWPRVLSYAKALGGTRAGAVATTFVEQARVEQFCSAVIERQAPAYVRAAADLLLEQGCRPDVVALMVASRLERAWESLRLPGSHEDPAAEAPADGAVQLPAEGRQYLLEAWSATGSLSR